MARGAVLPFFSDCQFPEIGQSEAFFSTLFFSVIGFVCAFFHYLS